MNKSLKIASAIFLIVFSKVVLDISLISIFLEKINHNTLYKLILYTSIVGFVIIHIYNILQRLYSFIFSALFVFYIFSAQIIIYYSYPSIISKDYMLYTTPGFIIIGNLLLFLLFKGISQRINNEEFSVTDKIINIAKNSGLLAGSVFLIFFVLNQNIINISFYHGASLITLLAGFYFLSDLILNTSNCNNIIDNQQIIRVKNKFSKLATDSFFIILIITSSVIAIVFTISFKLFTTNTLNNYYEFRSLVRIFAFYSLLMSIIGFAYELFLRKKMILYLGIKNVIRILPVLAILFTSVFFINNFTSLFSGNSDWNFIYLTTSIFLMIFVHFSLENISIPTTYTFYLPIFIETRQDFYTKSFIFGLLSGIGIGSSLIYGLSTILPYEPIQTLPFAIVVIAFLLYYLNSKPVYKLYRIKLQQFLDIQSRNIAINLGLFKDIENNKLEDFEGIQFVRYINLLHLTNPSLARKAIEKTIISENNLTQKVSLIKADEICMLETLEDLYSLKKSKYFPSSPNRDTIDSIIDRFTEVSNRMNSKYYVDQLSISRESNERVFGAKLSYYLSTNEKNNIISRLLKDVNLPVIVNAIISSQGTEKIETIKTITAKLNDPALGNAAYSTLLYCGDIILPVIEESFYETGQSEKVQLRIIQLFGDIANEEATTALLQKLSTSNQNITSATFRALSKCSISLPEDKTTMLKHELEELCQILVWNMSLLLDLEKDSQSEVLKKAMQTEIDTNYESIFNLLSLLYNAKSIMLIRNNLFSNDFEKITFAIELASVLLKDEIKLLIIPLIQPTTSEEKIAYMQDLTPTEKLSKRDVLYTILQRESKWINQWTKACAMYELAKDERELDIPIMLSNMINPDPMLAELAAKNLFKLNMDIYFDNKKIFGKKYISLFDRSILSYIEQDLNIKDNFPVLKYDIINYLHKIEEFSSIPGEILKKLTDHILPVEVKKGEVIEQLEDIEVKNYFYILYSGRISLVVNDQTIKSFKENSFISSLDLLSDDNLSLTLTSDEDSVLYKISPYGFIELLTFYDLIPETIINKTKNNKLTEYEDFIKRRRILNVSKTKKSLISYNQN